MKAINVKMLMVVVLFSLLFYFSTFLYLRYFNRTSFSLKNKASDQREIFEERTVFSELSNSYVVDTDLGAVPGVSEMNDAAKKLVDIYTSWSVEGSAPVSIDDIYDRFIIVTILDSEKIGAKFIKNGEFKTLELRCLANDTALFKSGGMQFVSANFDIVKAMKVGDMLYTKCLANVCGSVGPECIIVRRAKN